MSSIAIPAPRTSPWAALPVVLAGTFMVVLDFFIVNVAMPAMQADLHASTGAIEWVVAGYGLTFATLLITAGRLGDQLGRRRMFSAGLILFTLASAACGLSTTPEMLIVARAFQGAAAALLSTNVLSIIGVTYTGPDRLRALSIYGTVLGLAAVGGQLIGGALVEAAGWRSIFLINVPVGVVALALTPQLVPESRADRGSRLDLIGTALITLALVGIVLPLVEGRQHGWPLWTWLCLAAAPVTLALFAAQQRALHARGGAPLLDPSLFRDRGFSAGLLTQLAFWSGQASFFLVFALYLQQGRGLGALQAGLVFTILAVSYMAASMKATELIDQARPRRPRARRADPGRRPRDPRGDDRRRGRRRSDRGARPRAAADRRRDGHGHHPAHLHGAGRRPAAARGRRVGRAVDDAAGRQRDRCRGHRDRLLRRRQARRPARVRAEPDPARRGLRRGRRAHAPVAEEIRRLTTSSNASATCHSCESMTARPRAS